MENVLNIKFHDFPGKSFAESKRRNVKIVCDGKTFPLHKAVLSACSKYFSNLFREQVECPQRVIELNGIQCNEFENLLKYMYEGEVFVKHSEICHFMEAAEYLQLAGISDIPLSARLLGKKQKLLQSKSKRKNFCKKEKSRKLQFTKRIGLTPFSNDGDDSDDSFQGFSDAHQNHRLKTEMDDSSDILMDIKEEVSSNAEDELFEPWAELQKEILQCEICFFKTTIPSNFHLHNLSHIPRLTYSCQVCSYETAEPAQFERHCLKHPNDKNLRCHLCKYKALNAHLLSIHVRTHSGRQPYVCKVSSCSYKDTQAKTFQDHMAGHKLPHMCVLCSYRSASGDAMTVHMATHAPERSYRCNTCPYITHKVEHIRRHALIHRRKKHSSSIPITLF